MLRTAQWVIAQNNEMRNQLLEFYNLPKDKVVVINNPVDKDFVIRSANISVSPYPKEETVFLNICNIAYSKGIDVLIKAWDKVLSKIPSAHLYIVGRNNTEYARNLVHNAMGKRLLHFLAFRAIHIPILNIVIVSYYHLEWKVSQMLYLKRCVLIDL